MTADVVIVGGGASVPWHVLKNARSRVVLLKSKSEVGTGSTSKATGSVRQFSTAANIGLTIPYLTEASAVTMFRSVRLPGEVAGKLVLHSTPGRYEALEQTWTRIQSEGVHLIVSLTPPDEIHRKSPAYGAAIESKTVPCRVEPFPIADRGVPEDRAAFWSLALAVAQQLKAGRVILIHCGAGIGRTGTLAISVLLALGESEASAIRAVSSAGSYPETDAQRDLVSWCAAQHRGRDGVEGIREPRT